ncbi:MAG: GNAT family N-acetyltransferase [Actinophytocola sp.]|uniref:GNAT family N-acetyltransferase n=1 Tax=Actinophytocola sp. TaxID=1872138 RepID=UPI003C74FC1D
MAKPYEMRLAEHGDLDTVMALLDARIHWLRARGSDQWSTGRTFRTRLTNNIERGETWLLEENGEAIATITLTTEGDPDFWTPDELRERAVYVSKMASKIERRGEGLGALMIRWTQDRAAKCGLDIVRWDAWRTNPQLQDYYLSIGARHVRTADVADRWSGALFEVPAKGESALIEQVTTVT